MDVPALNILVKELIARHTGGKEFFNALDQSICEEDDDNYADLLLNQAMSDYDIDGGAYPVRKYPPPVIIVSGKFGIHLCNYFRSTWHRNHILCVNGGIRDGQPVEGLEPHRDYIEQNNCIFLDDSFYSGRTRNAIVKKIRELGGLPIHTYVVYDGSKEPDPRVTSLYRYYDEIGANNDK